jgi:hypothetical protein
MYYFTTQVRIWTNYMIPELDLERPKHKKLEIALYKKGSLSYFLSGAV